MRSRNDRGRLCGLCTKGRHALLALSIVLVCVGGAEPAPVASVPEAAPNSKEAETANLSHRLSALREQALRLAEMHFGAAPDRLLPLGPDKLEGRLTPASARDLPAITLIARPLDRVSEACRQREIERLMPTPPPHACGWRVARLASMRGEAYEVQTRASYHVVMLFARHLVEIGGAVGGKAERQLVRDYAQDLAISSIEAADLRDALAPPDSERLLAAREQIARLELGDPGLEPSTMVFRHREKLIDDRLIALGERWFTREELTYFSGALSAKIRQARIDAAGEEAREDQLHLTLHAERDQGPLTFRCLVRAPNPAEIPGKTPRDETRRLAGSLSLLIATPRIASAAAPGGRGRHTRWPRAAEQVAAIDGYIVEISISTPTEADPLLAPEFLDAQMVRLLGQLDLATRPSSPATR